MRLILLALLSTLLLSASDIANFAKEMQYETVYDVAKARAIKEKKPIMLVMVTHYCPWCRKFERRTLKKESINKRIHKEFIPLILNREAKKYPKQFYTPRIPVTSPGLKTCSIKGSSTVRPWDFTSDLQARLRTLYTQ